MHTVRLCEPLEDGGEEKTRGHNDMGRDEARRMGERERERGDYEITRQEE